MVQTYSSTIAYRKFTRRHVLQLRRVKNEPEVAGSQRLKRRLVALSGEALEKISVGFLHAL